MNIQSLVEDTMLDDIVALLGTHGGGAQGVPRGFSMALDPFLDVGDVLISDVRGGGDNGVRL